MNTVGAATLPSVVHNQALARPDDPFLETVEGESLTFGEFDALVDLWAGRLAALGVGPGDRVATMLPASPEELAVWLAASWRGAVEVPINPAMTGTLLAHALTSSEARVIVASPDVGSAIAEVPEALGAVTAVLIREKPNVTMPTRVMSPEEVEPVTASRDFARPPAPKDTAAILFTSGTSGLPKGVIVPWGQIHATAEQVAPESWWTGDDAVYSPYPPFHVSGKAPVCAMAIRGGRVVLRTQFKTSEFFSDVRRHRCTMTMLVGGTAQFLLAQPASADDTTHPLRIVHMLPVIDQALEFEQRFGVRVCGSFNMTEVSCPIVTGPAPLHDPSSAGKVRPGYRARIVDELDREVPDGETGELVLRADRPWTFFQGYFGNVEATVASWRNQWFHTGDLFWRDPAGEYHFVERRSDTIRRRGENISASLLESLLRDFDEVEEAVVVGVPSPVGESEVMAWIVPAEGSSEELFSTLASRLEADVPAFMVPRYWRLTPALPRTPTAKVERRALKAIDEDTWDRASSVGRR